MRNNLYGYWNVNWFFFVKIYIEKSCKNKEEVTFDNLLSTRPISSLWQHANNSSESDWVFLYRFLVWEWKYFSVEVLHCIEGIVCYLDCSQTHIHPYFPLISIQTFNLKTKSNNYIAQTMSLPQHHFKDNHSIFIFELICSWRMMLLYNLEVVLSVYDQSFIFKNAKANWLRKVSLTAICKFVVVIFKILSTCHSFNSKSISSAS